MEKKRVLIFIDWFSPAFKAGGPIKSVTNIINALADEYEFDIITSDRDMGENTPLSGIETNKWIGRENYRVNYLTPEGRKSRMIELLKAESYDFVYCNSAFSKEFTLDPLRLISKLNIKTQVIVAPRGMFGPGALAIKPLKKKVFLKVAKLVGLYKNVCWQATNEIERDNIRSVIGPNAKYRIAGNISGFEVKPKEIEKKAGELKLVFFSRVSPKKNIKYILELIKELDVEGVSLDIYGPIEDDSYWRDCEGYIENHKLKANYKGSLKPSEVQEVLANYHYFILPTLHENFGHVIVEALVAGCGIIISDQTPWKRLSEKKIGWDISLDEKDNWLSALRECIELDHSEFAERRLKCYQFVEEEVDDSVPIKATKELFS